MRGRSFDMHGLRGFALAAGSLGLVALSTLPARAAETELAGTTEVAGGYSYIYASSSVSGVSGVSVPAGWFFTAGANISDAFAVVTDLSGQYESNSVSGGGVTVSSSDSIHTFLAGPRVQGQSGRISFYGQFLVGAARMSAALSVSGGSVQQASSASDTEFCFAPGAGLDFSLGEHAALRAGVNEQFIRSITGSTPTVPPPPTFQKQFQLQIGLVYRFGN